VAAKMKSTHIGKIVNVVCVDFQQKVYSVFAVICVAGEMHSMSLI